IATGDEKYRQRAQFAIDQIVKKQLPVGGDEFSDPRDDGGWGYGATADGAHMNMVIYALYAAKQWRLKVPSDTWERAKAWVRRNQTSTGGWLYNLVDSGSPWADGVYGSMTATGLWALRACGVPVEDPQVQKGIDWLRQYWTLTRNPGSTAWHYYYLVALQRFCDIPPQLDTLVGQDWYQEIANMLVAEQQSNGRWIDYQDYFPTTCFALLFLSRSLPEPTQPDLGIVPHTLRFSPPSPRVGEPMQISVTIQNTGTVVDGLATIDFYAGDPKKQGQRIAGQEMILDSNYRETTVSVDWVAKEAREQQIFVIVDPQQKIADLNRENNQAVAKINIRPKSAQAIDPTLAVKKLGPNRYQIGAVLVDTESGTVSIPGQINIISPETILEFFACTGRGKTHESLVMVEAEPIHIQLGLLRLNMNPGMNLTAQGDPHTPTGDPADIW
ncbi:MAG: YdjY domain-containing protein, partial [Candidatus Poribacteria bacterium]|nr:YdjY domain-containing protein [Candidatus Poribacteria bacterium]